MRIAQRVIGYGDSMQPKKMLSPLVLLLTILTAALIAAGCGESDSKKTSKNSKTAKSDASSSDAKDSLAAMTKEAAGAGCTVEKVKEREALHVKPPAGTKGEPPVTGDHYEIWARWGGYDKPVPDGYAVHNMEHGGVIAWYSPDISDDLQDTLINELPEDGDKWLVAPREAKNPTAGGITAAAWNVSMNCPKDAISELGTDGTISLLRTWFETTVSQGSEAEKGLDALVPFSKDDDTESLSPSLPSPVNDTSIYAT